MTHLLDTGWGVKEARLLQSNKERQSLITYFFFSVFTEVIITDVADADPGHFGVDPEFPDPDLDSRIHASD